MQRLVFYGKGGIGKSTISANISAALAGRGRRVLHVGCDPKHDSTVALMGGALIPTVLDHGVSPVVLPTDIVSVSPTGVHCVEAGGPQAGVGCAGRGISLTLEIMERAGMLTEDRYDVVVFDLLGDVVCGGFAAPLRRGVGEKVIIITSEEVMSLYAANNIARAVVTYAPNGIVCAGLLLNLRDREAELDAVQRFATLLGTPILGELNREPLIRNAEFQRVTAVQLAPEAPLSAWFAELAERLLAISPAACTMPSPLSDRDFDHLARQRFTLPPDFTREPSVSQAAVVQATPPGASSDELDRLRQAYKRDLKAGMVAVQRGLVQPTEALARLQRAYPEFTGTLQLRDFEP